MRIQGKTEEQTQNHPQQHEHENGGAGPSRHRPYSQEEARKLIHHINNIFLILIIMLQDLLFVF